MNKLSAEKKTQVVAALVEGCSVRSTSRLTGVSKGAILRLLAEVGTACAEYQSFAIRNVKAQRVQVDEIVETRTQAYKVGRGHFFALAARAMRSRTASKLSSIWGIVEAV